MTDDLDRIMAVMDAAFDPAYGEAWSRRQVGDALLLPNTFYLLAAPHGDLPNESEPTAGFVLSRGAADEEELLLLAVDPRYRRQGIGSALVEQALAFCHQQHYLRIILDTYVEREPAVKLFEKFHFRHGRTRKNGQKDLLYFYLDLYGKTDPH